MAATKFSPPTLASWHVPRHRLDDALDAGAQVPLTIVVGAPGAGKSAALAAWLSARPDLASIWLSCDERDADPVTFWCALTSALGQRWPDHWLDAADMLDESEPDLSDVAIAIVNGLAALGEPVVIVIDDVQFASAAEPSLTVFVECLPSTCRVILGSRTEPQLALHRLRAHGQLHEVRDHELRLTRAEVAALMVEFAVELTSAEVELLTTRTEGWTAGVQMAAVALRDESVPDLFLSDLAKTPRSITDFLGADVLERQPAEILDFLLATSILEQFDAEICAAVTERRDARALLQRVHDRHLFLIELGGDTYRYHHLFGDFVRQRLHWEDPDRERALHRRAAAYFTETGDIESAFGHLLDAGHEAEAFELLKSSLVGVYIQGDGRALHRLATKVGEAATGDPGRLADLALALAASAPAGQAAPWISRATKHAGDLSDTDRARLVVAQGLVGVQYGDAVEVERALSDHAVSQHLPDDEAVQYGPVLAARTRLWLGDLDGARATCEQTLDPLSTPTLQQVGLTGALAWVACVEGQLSEAEHLAERALTDAKSLGLAGHTAMVDAVRTRGRVSFERGDLITAEHELEQSLSISEDVRPSFALVSQLSLSRVWLADGRTSEALSGVERARAFLPPDSTSPLLNLCHGLEGRISIEIGDLDRATRCAQRLPSGHRASLLQARIALARNQPDLADDALARCTPTTMRERIDIALLSARVAHLRKSDNQELLLAETLAVAKTESFVVAIADELMPLAPRVTLHLRSGRVESYEQAVLDRLEREPVLANAHDTSYGPLSSRELTVARYLASRLTYKEIAAELFVSTNTLKTHVKRIYQKLGVSSRVEAVTEVRRLGLF